MFKLLGHYHVMSRGRVTDSEPQARLQPARAHSEAAAAAALGFKFRASG